MARQFTQSQFLNEFNKEIASCTYTMHPLYNVFNSFHDAKYYRARPAEFTYKYKVFATVAKVLQPSHIVELGACAGSSGHAYLSGAPNASYIGYDLFNTPDEKKYNPYAYAIAVLSTLTKNFKVIRADFREMSVLPKADLVVVDGAHDYKNCYEDIVLAFTSRPEYIWVDDYNGYDVSQAVGWAGRVKPYAWWQRLEYCDGGIMLKMR